MQPISRSSRPLPIEYSRAPHAPDTDPIESAKTRDRLFDEAADDGRTWLAGHWEFPGVGRIVRLNGRRVFQAL